MHVLTMVQAALTLIEDSTKDESTSEEEQNLLVDPIFLPLFVCEV